MTSLSGLFRYPVNSMGGEALSHSEVGAAGLPGDRGWALSDGDRGAGQGAKRYPALMGYEARYLEPPGKRGEVMIRSWTGGSAMGWGAPYASRLRPALRRTLMMRRSF